MTVLRQIEEAPLAGVLGPPVDDGAAADAPDGARTIAQKSLRARRPRLPDEERRLLREAEAAFEGSDRRHDVDEASHLTWEREDGLAARAAPSRLFRD